MPCSRETQWGDCRDVDRLRREQLGLFCRNELGFASRDSLADAGACLANKLAERRLLIGGHIAQERVEGGER